MKPEPEQRIDTQALQVWRITGGITALFYWLIPLTYVLVATRFKLTLWISVPLILFAIFMTILEVLIMPKIRWQQWRYDISENEIDLKYGVFIFRRVLIPMVRIQHVDTKQGPFLRKYGLATVTVSTAARTHEIPALAVEMADAVRDRIAELAKVANEDV